jgi:HAD superfamily hydrolase (TIGR01490 family)
MKVFQGPMTRIAVFDVDRTLLLGTSVEIQLVRFLSRKRLLPSANLIRAFAWIPRLMPLGLKEAVLRNKFYLYGMDARFVRGLLPEFFRSQLKPLLSRKLLERMRRLKEDGYGIVLISGTLDFVLDFLIEALDAHAGLGTQVSTVNGKFTGRTFGVYPFHRDKITALKKILDGRPVRFDESTAFADSWADVPLLSLFRHPVAVNPDWILRKECRRRGWTVITESVNHRNGRET